MFKFRGPVRVYLRAIDKFLDRHPLAEPRPLSYAIILHERGWPWHDWQVRCIEQGTCLVLATCKLHEDAEHWAKGFAWSNAFDRPFALEWLAGRKIMEADMVGRNRSYRHDIKPASERKTMTADLETVLTHLDEIAFFEDRKVIKEAIAINAILLDALDRIRMYDAGFCHAIARTAIAKARGKA